MPPRKTATKRRSDSPVPDCEVEKKKYCTRASNRARINYEEDANCAEDENAEEVHGNKSDEDFIVSEAIEFEAPTVSKQRTRMKHTTLSKSCTSVSVPTFKPVNIDTIKFKSELDLSDSDSDISTDNDTSTNKYLSLQHSSINSSYVQEKADREQIQSKKEGIEANNLNDAAEIWSTNLEALNRGKMLLGMNEIKEEADDNPSILAAEKAPKGKQPKERKTLFKTRGKASKSSEINKDAGGIVDVSELLKLEKMQADISDESDDDENWEKVKEETVKEGARELPDKVEVTLDVGVMSKKKRKELDIQNMIRLKLNRIRREIQQDLHQVSLVGLLAHGFLVNKMLNDPDIAASALSIVPHSGFPPSRTDLSYLEKLVNWIHKHFKLKQKTADAPSYPGKPDVLRCISSGEATSKKELVYTSIAICRALGILARLVWSLQPISPKVDASELQPKTSPDSTNKSNKTIEGEDDEDNEPSRVKATPTSSKRTRKKTEKESDTGQKAANQRVTKSGACKTKEDSQAYSKTGIAGKKNTTSKGKKKENKRKGNKEPDNNKKSQYFDEEEPSKKKSVRQKKDEAKTPKEASKSGNTDGRTHEAEKSSKTFIRSKGKNLKEEKTKEIRQSRSRRKSTEKQVNYQESSMGETEEELPSTSKSIPKKGGVTKRAPQKESKSKSKSRNSKADSSDEFEAIMEEDSDEETAKSNSKEKKSPCSKSRKIISTDSEADALRIEQAEKKKRGCNVWMEIYLEHEEQWMSVDIIGAKVHCDRHIERNASSIVYVVAFNPDSTWKDVTARYASSFYSVTRKQRAHKGWSRLLALHLEKPSARSKAEDENLERSLTERPMPTSVSEFKNHPLYALQRHLLKFEAIYPPTAMPLGYIRGEPVYARECVKCLHSRDTWLKEAKVVRIGEKPYKVVKARPKWDRYSQKMVSDLPLELFGDWQVEDYVPPPAVDGVVPRNAYGNVELFRPSMLPIGTVHLQIQGLNKIARRLGIDCAPAMTGWEARGGFSCPVYDGYIVCEENVETLLDAWQAASAEQEAREREKREKRVYGNWRRLIRGLLIKERLHAKYFSKLTEEEPEPAENADSKPVISQPGAKTSLKKRASTCSSQSKKKK